MTISEEELEIRVSMAVFKMAIIKEETFWKSFAEVLFEIGRYFDHDVYIRIIDEAHARLEEFEKAWQINLYNRRFLK